jgi:hypothetical protein
MLRLFFSDISKEEEVARHKIRVGCRIWQSYSPRCLDTCLSASPLVSRCIIKVDHEPFQCVSTAMRSDVGNYSWHNEITQERCIISRPFRDIN